MYILYLQKKEKISDPPPVIPAFLTEINLS